jgi:hypothetical protein
LTSRYVTSILSGNKKGQNKRFALDSLFVTSILPDNKNTGRSEETAGGPIWSARLKGNDMFRIRFRSNSKGSGSREWNCIRIHLRQNRQSRCCHYRNSSRGEEG